MSAKLLSSLVQTKSIELVLAPIAAQVSQLILLNEAAQKEGVPLPDLVPSAQQIRQAVESLVLAGQKLVSETPDNDLKLEMPAACDAVKDAGNSLLMATHQLKQQPFSNKVRYNLVDSARNILEGTMKVLLVYDEAEIRKIVTSARWVMDRLVLVEAVTSPRGLVVSFKSFTESLMLLATLCNKRQQELSNPRQRDRLLSAMMILKKSIGLLSTSMQAFLKNPTNQQTKASRDYVVGQIMLACTEIIKIVEAREDLDQSIEGPGYMAATLEKAHKQLSPHSRLGSGNELDCYLDAIVRSSMSVANSCEGGRKERIVQACQSVLLMRNELAELQKAFLGNPLSQRTRHELDLASERLSVELKKLDRRVSTAVIDDITTVFADPELPVHNMIQAATAPLLDMSVQSQEDAMTRLKGKADEFQKHAARLAEVAKQCAAISADARRVQAINGTADDIEKLAPQLMSAAVRVRQTPTDAGCTEHLGLLRRDWTARIHALTSLVDDITDFNDFVLMTDLNIQKDISCSQEALHQHDIPAVSKASLRMLGRARRVAMATKKEMNVTADPMYKGKLQAACGELESVVPVLVQSVEGSLINMADDEQHNKLCDNLKLLGDKVKMIKSALKRPEGVNIDLTDYSRDTADNPKDNMLDLFEILRGHRPASASDTVSVGELDLAELGSEPVKAESSMDLSSQEDVEPAPRPVRTKLPKEKRDSSRDRSRERSRDRSRDRSRGLNRSTESEDLLFNFSEDDEMDRINRKALLGISAEHCNEPSLTAGVVRPIKPSQSARAPVSRLLNAVKVRDFDLAERELRKVESRASALRTLAGGCADKSRKGEGVRLVRVSSGEIEKLTPLIVQAARDFQANPRDVVVVERLQTIGREWASKVHVLSGAVDEIVQPWSAAASKLALAATSGDAEQLMKQVDNVNRHVLRLRQLAVAAKAAADAEDYAMDAGNEGEAPARDPASLQRVELVRASSGEVERMTPQLITAAQALSRNPTDIANVERLEVHRRDWASKVYSLVFAVDDVTVGTSAPVEQLTSVALAADQHALQEHSRMLTSYSRTLKEMEIASTAGCNDPKKVSLAEATVNSVEKLTADLQDTARVVSEMASREHRTLEQSLAYMGVVERMNLLQREWATKVHLLTALVDDLTAEASAPVDRLAGAALAVSKAELGERIQQQSNFEMQADELKARVARVRTHASKAVENSRHTSKVRHVRVTGDFIDRLTPQVIAAARALADNPDQPTVEHFQMLRRQWASKAQLLMAILDGLPDADTAAVQDVFQALLGIPHMDASHSFESLNEEEAVAIAGSSRGIPSLKPLPPEEGSVQTSLSPTRSLPTTTDRSPEISSYFDDMALSDRNKSLERSFSLSDTESAPEVRRLRGPWGSASETDLTRKALVDELHQRFSSAESLNRSGGSGRFRQHQRAASISGLSRAGDLDWRTPSIEELRAKKSSKSIELAAQLLQEETDKWEEENNSIVKVAKEMAQQMLQIAKFARGRNRLQNKMEMINMAKAIASNAMFILKFAHVIAEQSVDERSKSNLLYYAEYLPTISTQLKIISSVKAATPSDISADAMLVKNAQNLMQAVVKTLKAAEAACVKGLRPPEQDASSDHTEAADLAFQWKKKLRRQRAIEALTASRDELGLRRREKNISTPSLVDIVHV